MRLTNLLSYSSPTTLLATLLTACGSDGAAPARFTEADEAHRVRALTAAAGGDAGLAFVLGSFATAAAPESTCPSVVRVGDRATATFDCTDSAGTRIDGCIVATNLGDLLGDSGPAADPTKDVVLAFEGFRQHGAAPAEQVTLDGRVALRPDGAMVAALEVGLAGITALTDATLVSNGALTSAVAGGSIEVDGLGRATIHGAWSLDEDNPAGALELRGADVLRADFADAFGGCVPITIDGHAAGQLCQDSEQP